MNYQNTILEKIVIAKKEELSSSKMRDSLFDLKQKARDLEPTRDFIKNFDVSLTPQLPATRIIAEIKKASPSAGLIRNPFSPAEIAKTYLECGVAAISVLTDPAFFQGSLDHLQEVRRISDRPLLRKDFMIDEYQIYQARAYGADCILLIAALLEKSEMEDMAGLAAEMGLSSLIEIHDEEELQLVLQVKTSRALLGINNRDLKTLKMDLSTTEKLRAKIPLDQKVISESGIQTRSDINRLLQVPVNGFLIGEHLLKQREIKTHLLELIG
ncbi:MAG: indole-3-glycerol phosphate synthase TrpC [Deltaproteobacteria bacterium]|nr:indole-3-glycerol phosphate synthase TrpC [Deltaproteobacteria bacterium]